jgi:nitrite reductase/ring-hydroxylating ferredoxin subunit
MLPSGPGQYVYGLEGRILSCPWHKWQFDLETGRSVFETDRRRLIGYELEIENDDLYVLVTSGVRADADADAGA